MATAKSLSTATEVENIGDAKDATSREHQLSFWEALKLYPTGVFWSVVMSTAVIMEGYDTKLIGTLFAQPTFQQAFGHKVKSGYQISAAWQAGLSNGSGIGQLLGLLLSGYLSEQFGFRKTMLAGMFAAIGLIFIIFFSPNLIVLEIGEILFGIPLGLFQTLPVVYGFEVTPLCLRAYLTNYVNFCWAFGQLLAAGVLRAMLSRSDQWAYRIPFALQWIWPVILIPAIYLAPESPWWLVRRGRVEEAKQIVQRLTSRENVEFDVDKNVALMVVTTEHERRVNAQTSYKACFEGTNFRRTIVAIGIYCIQNANGNPIRGYSTYFLQQAGLPTTQAFNMTIGGFAVAIVGGFFSWTLLPLFGRRSVYLSGLTLMLCVMLCVGGLGFPQATHPKSNYAWAIGSLLLISSFIYNCSIGPLTNTIIVESSSALLRSKTIVLARWIYACTNIIFGVLTPYMLNPTAWNWGARTGLFFAGGCILSILFAWFLVPETKDRTTAEMDILFERKTPARHFAQTPVDLMEAVSGQPEHEVVEKV